jgi:outer membrane lipoprotein-sorting protein
VAASFLALAIVPAPFAQSKTVSSSDPRALAIVKVFEEKLNVTGLDVTNTFTLVQKKAGEADRVIQIQIYRRDSADTFTLVFKYPESEKGKGYYRNKDDLFLYLPSTREFVYRNRKDDVGSTDVRTDIFGKSDVTAQYWANLEGSASGTLLRTTYYLDYKEVTPGRFIFTKLLATDALEKGQQTLLTNENISTAKIPDYTFSKAFLEEQSR